MSLECIVLREHGGSSRRVGGVINLDAESFEDRISMVSSELNGKFFVEERYPLSQRASQIILDTEKRGGGVDVSLRQFIALVYLEARREEREELLDLFAKKMEPKEN